ncbi:hypothetical protein [Halobacterium sp. R2-5]|uniref:hypothetical protein n=1 Tax=Halobacterium sp. R2-5 TaxID=2715751 RepID=UPI00141EB2F0|nr:hypothetical protein [Halobacterium sp. R2-5]NIB98547.1 hypothetical protein [Halobacterium sp. R2-5]
MKHRRQFLRSLGVVGAAALAGCGGRNTDETPDSPETRSAPQPRPPETSPARVADELGLDEVRNLADAGADTTGSEPIDDLLVEEATDGRLLYLPPGRYRVDDTIGLGADRLGVFGNDATIVPRDGYDTVLLAFGYPEPAREVSIQGVTFDFTANQTGGRPILARAQDSVVIRDVAVAGEVDVDNDVVRLDVTDPDGTGLVERLSLPDGSMADSGVTGAEVGAQNHGDVSFVDCHIEGFADNGLYADPPEGSITVEGGLYKNNGISSIRIQTSESSVVRGAHVVCDDGDLGLENMRGIRLRAGEELLVENCVVEMLEVSSSDGAITFASELESATVRNCQLRVDADDVNAVRVKSPSRDEDGTQRGPFRCEDITITGSASGGAAIVAANRDQCEFRNVCVHQPGENRDGLSTQNVAGELVDASVAVTGDPLSLQNSSIQRSNVTLSRDPGSASCENSTTE